MRLSGQLLHKVPLPGGRAGLRPRPRSPSAPETWFSFQGKSGNVVNIFVLISAILSKCVHQDVNQLNNWADYSIISTSHRFLLFFLCRGQEF